MAWRALSSLTVAAVASVIIWEARQKAISDHESQAVRFVGGSEAALNRALLSVDMLLAGANESAARRHRRQRRYRCRRLRRSTACSTTWCGRTCWCATSPSSMRAAR
jgi:hypothetical protein